MSKPVDKSPLSKLWHCPETDKPCYDCDGPCQLTASKESNAVMSKASRRAARILADKNKQPKPEPEVVAKGNLSLLPPPEKTQVTVIRDHALEYPQLYLEVYFSMPDAEGQFAELLSRCGCRKAKSLAGSDLVIFPGGADIDPILYGDTEKHERTTCNLERDRHEFQVYNDAVNLGIPMLGICRGAQLLHVANKGKMYQDVDGHHTSHPIFDVRTKEWINRVSSTHHQMVIANNNMEVIAYANGVSRHRWDNGLTRVGTAEDVEAFYYPDTCCLGIQGHPEYKGYPMFSVWSMKLVEHYIMENPKVVSINNNYRFKPPTTVTVN